MERILDADRNNKEADVELSLRPTTLAEYIGQDELKQKLEVYIGAAKHRDETIDHILLYGPPGLGKTTIANVVAKEMGGNIKIINGPSIEKTRDLALVLNELEPGDILFIDEIHRLPRVVEEVLYSAMEDFVLSIVIGRDDGGRAMNITLPPFTLIGATTRAGDLSAPLRARFGITEKFNYYTVEELTKIVLRTSKVLKTDINEEGAKLIAKRSRGTPRIANRLYRRVRDFANYEKLDYIDYKTASKGLEKLHVDSLGLDEVDIKYLSCLINRYNCGPVGLEAVATSIGEERMNLEDVYEPYLVQLGFIDRTRRGRIVTDKGLTHMKEYHSSYLFKK